MLALYTVACRVSLRMHVFLFVTSRCTETAKLRLAQTTLYTMDQGLQFSGAKDLGEIRTGSPQRGHKMQVD